MRIVVLRRSDDTRPAAVVSTEPRCVACQGTGKEKGGRGSFRAGEKRSPVPFFPPRAREDRRPGFCRKSHLGLPQRAVRWYGLVRRGPVRTVLPVLPTARLSALVRLFPTDRDRPVSRMLRGLSERCRGQSPARSPGPAGCTAHTGRPFHTPLANGWGFRLSTGRSPPGLPILIPSYWSAAGHGRARGRTAAWLGRWYVVVP